jgi:hypothetical protein
MIVVEVRFKFRFCWKNQFNRLENIILFEGNINEGNRADLSLIVVKFRYSKKATEQGKNIPIILTSLSNLK